MDEKNVEQGAQGPKILKHPQAHPVLYGPRAGGCHYGEQVHGGEIGEREIEWFVCFGKN